MLFERVCVCCGASGPCVCDGCLSDLQAPTDIPDIPGVTVDALFEHDSVGSSLVSALKYRNARLLIPWLGTALARRIGEADLITWAPTTARHKRERGFDQAALLAKAAARSARIPLAQTLRRTGNQSQTGASRKQRLAGPQFAPIRRLPERIVLVDDVITTGSTVAAAANALRMGGAKTVHAVALSHRGWIG